MSHTATTPTRSFGYYLNGNWSTSGREAVVTSPYDHSVVAVVYEASRDDVETAIQSAVQAFAITRKLTSYQRTGILRRIAEGIRHRREEFARTICQEAGKPIKTASRSLPKKPAASMASTSRSTPSKLPPDDGDLCVASLSDPSSRLRPLTFR
jgi:hypothetical protein